MADTGTEVLHLYHSFPLLYKYSTRFHSYHFTGIHWMNSHCLTATGYLRTSNEVNGPSWCWSTGDNVIIFVPISVNVAQRRRRSINWPQPRETAFFSFLIRHKPRPSCVWNQVMREIRANETAQCRSLWSVPHGYDTGLILRLDRPDVEAGQQQTADFLWFLCFEFFVFFLKMM